MSSAFEDDFCSRFVSKHGCKKKSRIIYHLKTSPKASRTTHRFAHVHVAAVFDRDLALGGGSRRHLGVVAGHLEALGDARAALLVEASHDQQDHHQDEERGGERERSVHDGPVEGVFAVADLGLYELLLLLLRG